MPALSPAERLKPVRILHLEDNRDDCVLIRQKLLNGGLECALLPAATRAEYERAIQAGGIDLILSAYTLPGYSGEAALTAARTSCPAVPFIFVSGTLGEEKAVDALKGGATDYVLKARLERLVPAVRRALDEARERRRRRETEAALSMSDARVQEMTDKQRQLEAQLQQAQKMDMIGQLAGGIAHDFNNLLTVINGHSSLLLDKPDLPPRFVNSIKEIFVAGGRAAGLTRQLLIFSRKDQSDSRPVDLNEIIVEISTMLRRMIGEHIRLDLDLARGLPPILADAGMIEQVLLNLVVNARDAMPKGGSLVISTGAAEITAADGPRHPAAMPGPHVCLGVRDAGSGIAPDILPRIFEPFFTTKALGKGTGLGLSTVFAITRQHHGWVEVESEVGLGTVFRVYLPVAPAEARVTPVAPRETGLALPGRETILLVEDEASVREFASIVLQMHGYKVLQAASGVEALETWEWHGEKISLLLTDLVLPDDITGPELAEKLRARRPDLKVLFCSGYNPETASQILSAHPGFTFLRKPYQPRTLARAVREMLDCGIVTPATPSQTPFA